MEQKLKELKDWDMLEKLKGKTYEIKEEKFDVNTIFSYMLIDRSKDVMLTSVFNTQSIIEQDNFSEKVAKINLLLPRVVFLLEKIATSEEFNKDNKLEAENILREVFG